MSSELTQVQQQSIDTIIKKEKMTLTTYKAVLSNTPPKEIVKRHEYGKFDYLPITAVERLLDGLFEGWSVEVLREGAVVNGFYCVVRLRARIPGSETFLVADGIGASEFQTTKGNSPTDFNNIMPGAIVMAVPRAKAEAMKNAAKSFGNIFGRNLTRKDDNAIAEAQVVNISRSKIANTLKSVESSNENDTTNPTA